MAKIGRKRSSRRRSAGKNRSSGGRSSATIRISLRTIAFLFPPLSLQRVYFHGKWQESRGRMPTLTLKNQKDPLGSFVTALELEGEYLESIRTLPCSRQSWFWDQELILAILEHIPINEL